MKPAALCARLALALGVVAATTPSAATTAPVDPYQPLAFLIGRCWKGAFAGDAGTTDEHCSFVERVPGFTLHMQRVQNAST